jgi:hypothetical protein
MKLLKKLPLLAALCACLALQAQNAGDALRFSTFHVGGTSRFVGVGGALGALGSEFSVLSTNPAGLAMYRSSEFSISPSLLNADASSRLEGAFLPVNPDVVLNDFNNPALKRNRNVFNLQNAGFVINSTPRDFKFSTFNFGIGFNHLGNFNQEFFFEGRSAGSIVERWQELANNFGLNDFEAGPAWDAFAIYDIEGDEFYETDYELTYDNNFIGAPIRRNQLVTARGSMSELVLSMATNYMERVMFGITIGVPLVSYRQTKTYREIDDGPSPNGDVPFFDDLTFEESLRITGAGINLKAGLIIRPVHAVRLGFAAHTPTAFSFDDNYQLSIAYNFTDSDGPFSGFGESQESIFDYRLNTPWRFFGSAGFIFEQYGFLTAEVEYVDYSSARFRYNNFPVEERQVNEEISNSLQSALNIRLGGELAYESFRFRAGFGILPSTLVGLDQTNYSYSAGIGVRGQKVFLDLAYRRLQNRREYVPYGTFDAPQQLIDNRLGLNTFILTFGVRY